MKRCLFLLVALMLAGHVYAIDECTGGIEGKQRCTSDLTGYGAALEMCVVNELSSTGYAWEYLDSFLGELSTEGKKQAREECREAAK